MTMPSTGSPRIMTPSLARNISAALIALIFLVIVILPIVSVGYGALRDRSPVYGNTQWSLEGVMVLVSGELNTGLRNSLALSLVVMTSTVIIGVVLAWFIVRTNVPAKRFLTMFIVLPLFISPLTGALSWLILGAPNVGLLNIILRELFGIENLVNIFTFQGVAFVMVLNYIPYAYLASAAMFTNMNASFEEAARVLGAGPLRTAWRITMQLILPAITSASVLIFMLSIEMFSIPGLLGRPFHFETLISNVYYAIRQEPARWNVAAAIGLLLLCFVLLAMFIQRLFDGRSRLYAVLTGQAVRARTLDLGRFRWPVFAGMILVIFVTVVLPFAALFWASLLRFTTSNVARMIYTWDNYQTLTTGPIVEAIVNTLILSVSAPTAVVLIVLSVGYWCRRYSTSVMRPVFTFLTRLPLALPGIILGVGLLWLYFLVPLPIYGTLLILFLAYTANCMPYAATILFPALSQIDRSLDESARTLGASPLTVMRRIHMPLTARAIVAAWLIAFIICSRELNASIVLYTPNTRVMEVLIWDFTESGQANVAYALSVVQAVALGLVALLVQRFIGGRAISPTVK